MGRNMLMLAGLLCIAVALGIGIGVLVASLKAPQQRPAVVNPSLEPRITSLEREMETRTNRGEKIPPEAWKLIANARAAIAAGDEPVAREKIAQAEKLVRQQ
jgi:hypothetical protein